MAQGRVIIVGEDGQRHVFPPGFDPKKAAAIVRGQATQATAPQQAEPSTADNIRGALQWGGKVIAGMTGMGEAGRQAVEHPTATLVSAAAPVVVGAAGRAAAPHVAPMVRKAADIVAQPLVSGAIGAGSGYAHGGIPGAVYGGAAGVASGVPVARGLRKLANRMSPPQAPPSQAVSPAPQPPASRTGTQWAPGAMPAPMSRPAPAGAPVAPVAKSAMSPQRIQNELGLAARRAGLKLSETQYEQAAGLVGAGRSPLEAVRAVAPGPIAVPKGKLTAAQTKEYLRLRSAGKSDAEAKAALDAVQALASKLGGPTPEQARAAVQVRNATGRWQ